MDDNLSNGEAVKKKGSPVVWIVVGLLILLAIVAIIYYLNTKKSSEPKSDSPVATEEKPSESNKTGSADVRWEMVSDGNYQPSGTAPTCPTPLVLAPPTDLSKVVSVLYPGQTRGGNYKPHGGLRFADGKNEVTVTAPMDATVVDGGRYLVSGEVQYLFDFVNSCGIKYRLGHLRTLSEPLASLASTLPAAKDMDSRTTQINSTVKVKAGDTIATAVGLLGEGNAFFDYGVFDLRQENEASKSAAYQQAHSEDRDQAWHALCWLDLLSPANKTIVKNLPATSPGSQSDYCK